MRAHSSATCVLLACSPARNSLMRAHSSATCVLLACSPARNSLMRAHSSATCVLLAFVGNRLTAVTAPTPRATRSKATPMRAERRCLGAATC